MNATAWAFPTGKQARPYMQRSDVEAISTTIEQLRPKKVLEYGAGGSSVYFPSVFPFIGVWLAIEDQAIWASEVMSQAGEKSALVIYAVHDADKNYVTAPDKYKPFDLIIIDGLKRMECLEHSKELIAPGGLVLLHDADRKSYKEATKIYPHWKRLTNGNTPDGFGYMKRDGILMMWGDE